MSEVIIVGMADLNATKGTGVLMTLGLGSCVGIALHDPSAKVAGLAHIMLPDSKQIQNNNNPYKFADTALDKLIEKMLNLGASKLRMTAKIAGGSQMFNIFSSYDNMRIGDLNVAAVVENLQRLHIPVIGQDTGSTYGRTVTLYAEDGRFLVKTIGHGSRWI